MCVNESPRKQIIIIIIPYEFYGNSLFISFKIKLESTVITGFVKVYQ